MLRRREPWPTDLPLPPMTLLVKLARRGAALAGLSAGLALAPGRTLAQVAAPATIRLSPDDLERGQYGPQHNFYFLPPGRTAEADYQSAGFFGAKLRPYLQGSAPALAELDRYKRQKTLYLVDKAVLLSAAGLYASQVFRDQDAVYFNPTQRVAAGAAVLSLVATLFINRHTNEYLKQAVDNYNSNPPRRTGASWLRPAGVGVGATNGRPVLALSWQL